MRWIETSAQLFVQLCLLMPWVGVPTAYAVQSDIKTQAAGMEPPGIPSQLEEVGVTEHLGERIPIEEFTLINEAGEKITLSDHFKKGKPVVITPIYYGCPNLCQWGLKGLVKTLKGVDWTPGDQFEIVTFSINPNEKPALASKQKAAYLESYGRPKAGTGWHFLTGEEKQVSRLAKTLGFGYKYDPKEQQYGHSAALMVLTPQGKISRYLYGIEFQPKDFRMALLEASSGKIGNVVDRFLLFCFRYDPQTRKYSIYSIRLMEAGCLGTVIVFGGYLLVFWRRQRKGA